MKIFGVLVVISGKIIKKFWKKILTKKSKILDTRIRIKIFEKNSQGGVRETFLNFC